MNGDDYYLWLWAVHMISVLHYWIIFVHGKYPPRFSRNFFFFFNLYSTIFKTRGIKNILSSLKCDLFHTIQLVWSSFPTPEPEPDPPVPSFSYLYMPRALLTHLGPQESHSPNFAGFRTDSLAYEDAQPSGEDLMAQN